MKVKIGIGLDDIVFGMMQDEVKKALGEPNKISETEKMIILFSLIILICRNISLIKIITID